MPDRGAPLFIDADRAFDEFFRTEYQAVVRLAFVLCGSLSAAEDLAQDALLGPILGLDEAVVARTDRIKYSHRADEAMALATGDTIAILLRAPTIAQVEETALASRTMPQKSTYFYPKTVDGLVFYGLDDCT